MAGKEIKVNQEELNQELESFRGAAEGLALTQLGVSAGSGSAAISQFVRLYERYMDIVEEYITAANQDITRIRDAVSALQETDKNAGKGLETLR